LNLRFENESSFKKLYLISKMLSGLQYYDELYLQIKYFLFTYQFRVSNKERIYFKLIKNYEKVLDLFNDSLCQLEEIIEEVTKYDSIDMYSFANKISKNKKKIVKK